MAKMNRIEFLKVCSLFGISLPLGSSLPRGRSNLSTKVVIVGAGAAGLTTAYLLKQQGIDSVILEAANTIGGRMKRTDTFADFPIPLGAEWIHTHPRVLGQTVNDSGIGVDIKTTAYDPETTTSKWEGHDITLEECGFEDDYKFIKSTWFDFFEEYIYPSVKDQITFNSVVENIDYSKEKTTVKTKAKEYTADKVVVTIPVQMLQKGAIRFTPELPKAKQRALQKIKVWNGCKAFVEFKTCFYPTFTAFNIVPETAGQKLYYDAAYGQKTNKHILGLFAVGSGATPYQKQESDEALIQFILNELDKLYESKASKSYVKHIFQDWNKEPFIEGTYLYDHESWLRARVLGQSVEDKVFFAGEAYSDGENWGGVDSAISSARRAVASLVELSE